MDRLTQMRIRALDAINNCPACGGARLGSSGKPNGTLRVYFGCGSIFATYGGAPIEAELVCPAPSMTAASMINHEIAQADYAAQAKAGAA